MLGFAPLSSQPISDIERSPINGEATLAATARLNVVSGAIRRALVAVAASGQVSVAPGAVLAARATLRGAGAISSAAIRVRLSSASMEGTGTVQARGGTIARTTASLRSRAALGVEPTSAFQDLISNPSRRAIYTIEISPWLLVPYEDQA